MGILSDQNILGDPALADAIRPGPADGSAAAYSFATDYVMTGPIQAITPWFVRPGTYGMDQNTMQVTKSPPLQPRGIDGQTLLYDGTRYGNPGFNPLPDAHSTRLGSVAEVIAGNEEPEEDVQTSSTKALESYYNHEIDSSGGAVASGGESSGFDAQHEYEMTMGKNASQQNISNPGGHTTKNTQTSISVDGPSEIEQQMKAMERKPSLKKRRSYYTSGTTSVGDGITEASPFSHGGLLNAIPSTPGETVKSSGMEEYQKMMEKSSTTSSGNPGGWG